MHCHGQKCRDHAMLLPFSVCTMQCCGHQVLGLHSAMVMQSWDKTVSWPRTLGPCSAMVMQWWDYECYDPILWRLCCVMNIHCLDCKMLWQLGVNILQYLAMRWRGFLMLYPLSQSCDQRSGMALQNPCLPVQYISTVFCLSVVYSEREGKNRFFICCYRGNRQHA
jgi:hypothetical protein